MNTLRSIEIATATQTILAGQIVDSVTQIPINTVTISAFIRFFSDNDFVPFNAQLQRRDKGYFALTGSPQQLFPEELALDAAPEIRVDISANGYTAISQLFSADRTAFIPADTDIELAGNTYSVPLISSPLFQHTFALEPLPVSLQGFVIEDNDMDERVEGASVQVIAPIAGTATLTDANGLYRIDTLPIARTITLQVTTDEVSTVAHTIDFSTPLNTKHISLNG